MNNKGMTLIELLVAFTLLMIITIGLYSLITSVKTDLQEKTKIKQLSDYSNLVNSKIHLDLIKNKPFTIVYKNDKSDNYICKSKGNCSIKNDIVTTSYNDKNNSLDLAKTCTTFPCSVFFYLKDNKIQYNTIMIETSKDKGLGIKYNNIFESMPYQKEIRFLEEDKVYIDIDKDNYFIINFPYYIVGYDTNFGFKIAYEVE